MIETSKAARSEEQQQDQTELEPAHRVGCLPDLGREQQEHDEDQQDGQRPREQFDNMGDLLPQPLERPGADLDEPEADDRVDHAHARERAEEGGNRLVSGPRR